MWTYAPVHVNACARFFNFVNSKKTVRGALQRASHFFWICEISVIAYAPVHFNACYSYCFYVIHIFCLFSHIYHIFIFHLYQIANKWYPKNKNLLPETQLSENVYFSYFFQWFLKNEFYIEPKKKPLKLEYITRSRAYACSLKSIDLVGIWRDRSKKNDPPHFSDTWKMTPQKWQF